MLLSEKISPAPESRGNQSYRLLKFPFSAEAYLLLIFLTWGRTATTAPPERMSTAAHRARLLSSPVWGLAEAWALVSIWKVQLGVSP